MTFATVISIVALLGSFFSIYTSRQALRFNSFRYEIERNEETRSQLTVVLQAYETQLRTQNVADVEHWKALLQTTSLDLPLMRRAAFSNGDSSDTYSKKIKQHITDEARLGPVRLGDPNLQERALRAEVLSVIKQLEGSQHRHERELTQISRPLGTRMKKALRLQKNQIDKREEQRLARKEERAALEAQQAKIKPNHPPTDGAADTD